MAYLSHAQRKKRRKEIAAMYAETFDIELTAQHFGVSTATVRNACVENDVWEPRAKKTTRVPSRKPTIPSVSTLSIIAALINTEDTQSEIAAHFGVSRQRVGQIYQRCIEHGIPVAKSGLTIYALIDPRSGHPRYVGATTNLTKRRYNHRAVSKGDQPRLRMWKHLLRTQNLRPAVAVLETDAAETAERRWIRRLAERGYSLLNVDKTVPIHLGYKGRFAPDNHQLEAAA